MLGGQSKRKCGVIVTTRSEVGRLFRVLLELQLVCLLLGLTACSWLRPNLGAALPIATQRSQMEMPVVTPEEAAPVSEVLPSPSPTDMLAPTVKPPNYPYGVVYSFETSDWSEADREAVWNSLNLLNELGVTTTVQTFSSRLIGMGRESDWLIYLDEAERAGIKVVARLWPLEVWDGQDLGLDKVKTFLDVVGGHPALLAYIGLHEPLEIYDSDQLRLFYTKIKAINPDIPLAQYMGNMALFDSTLLFPNREFTAGICDICIIWSTPARYLDGEVFLDEVDVQDTVRQNRLLIDERAPESELWYLGQAYALGEHRHTLRMPTPEEMETIFVIARREGADGFLWYPWFHNTYDQVLSDPESAEQRQAVAIIARKYLGASE